MRRSSFGQLMTRTGAAGAAAGALLAASASSWAHHGPGAYDRSASVSVTGTVTRFEFVNPHVLIYVSVGDDGGETVWSGELTSPNRLARMQTNVKWHKALLAPGDVVTLTGNPARNGAPVLLLNAVEDADGRALTGRGR